MEFRTLGGLINEHGGLIQTGPFGSQLHQHDYSEIGVPVVMPKDIKDGYVDESTVARIPETKAQELSRHYLPPGSIVFPRRGEISKCALIGEYQSGYLCGTGCIKIEVPASVLVPRYLYYYMRLGHVVEWLERNAVGTTMLNLNTSIIGNLQVPIVSKSIQERVVETLAAYDDLIENNRRRIQLLEQAARLLYKEWFVHLRFPGHEHVKVVDSVPEGWRRIHVAALLRKAKVNLQTGPFGTQLRASDYTESGTSVINVRNIGYGGIRPDKLEYVPDPVVARLEVHVLRRNDIVFGRKGAVDRHLFVEAEQEGWIQGSDCIRLRFLEGGPAAPRFFSLSLRMGSLQQWLLTQCSNKATMASLNQDVISRIPLTWPRQEVLDTFDEYIEPMFKQIAIMRRSNASLSKARDLLLPRLMNGEISV